MFGILDQILNVNKLNENYSSLADAYCSLNGTMALHNALECNLLPIANPLQLMEEQDKMELAVSTVYNAVLGKNIIMWDDHEAK